MDYSKIEPSLIETLKTSDLSSLATNTGELALDTFLKDGLVKNIPILDYLQKLYKISQSYRGNLFQKKLIKFLYSLKDTSPEERIKFVDEMESNPNYKHKIGEQLLLRLDRMDDMEKPEMMGKVIMDI